MLIDHAVIFVKAGDGGDGSSSLRREKFMPKGGPDGGDGGRGGDIVLVGDESLDTLFGLTRHPHFRAVDGDNGSSSSRSGADADELVVRVPLGTLVYDHVTGDFLADVDSPGQRFVVARGGKGGLGNEHFKSATHQTPREFTPGEIGEERTLRLELKLIADVGLIGKPNAGKSTLLRAISRATPKVADYPFTTLWPHLGIAELPGHRRLSVADIPGLIEGASQGAGLGHDFLRHIERTSVLVHVLDVAPTDGSDPAVNYREIRAELAAYSDALAAKPELIALNKIDLVPPQERDEIVSKLQSELDLADADRFLIVSGATGQGTRELLEACWSALDKGRTANWQSAR